MTELLSGNEALALGAHRARVKVATAYPGTPSTEILEAIARYDDVYAEWSTNEKVAMEVALGAAYAGVRSVVSMKHVGLNVASDPFIAASMTGVAGGMVVITADDPGIHSSQNEQDSRHYAKLAKVPALEPADSQEAYQFMWAAFEISERFDTPVMVRSTMRISHSHSLVKIGEDASTGPFSTAFHRQPEKYVMVPGYARARHRSIEERMENLSLYAETFPLNHMVWGSRRIGIITSGAAYQYAREVFPGASFLKLGMVYPLPQKLIEYFAARVKRLIVIEELDPFFEDGIKALGIRVTGKDLIPRVGELNPDIIEERSRQAGLLRKAKVPESDIPPAALPRRNPRLCPGCPHAGLFFVLSSLGKRNHLARAKTGDSEKSELVITGDIGCYTLGTYPPLNAMDTCACMGASIGQAIGMAKAAPGSRVVAVIGDSTFFHSGITPLLDAHYNQADITVVILDNRTTAMTGHQDHPGTGITAQKKKTRAVSIEDLVRGAGIGEVSVVDAFDINSLRRVLKKSLGQTGLSVIVVRGSCSVRLPRRPIPMFVDTEKCNQCGICLQLGCPALENRDGQVFINAGLCAGDLCAVCWQICPRKAIIPQSEAGVDGQS
ncbi:MAG: indolepyruvate ferredoxin oxidoreductase subunit alpha [Dehalococcoidales bacterium]